MNSMRFVKGIGVGFIVGSAVGMAIGGAARQHKKSCHCKRSVIGRALQTVGDIVENIGESIGL